MRSNPSTRLHRRILCKLTAWRTVQNLGIALTKPTSETGTPLSTRHRVLFLTEVGCVRAMFRSSVWKDGSLGSA